MRRLLTLALTATLCSPAIASAQTITFDDLPSSCASLIPNGYQGFNWANFWYLSGTSCLPGSGYANGTVSGNVAFNAFSDPASMLMASGTPFTFNSVFMTAAWNDGVSVTVEGLMNSTVLFASTVTVSSHAATLFNFDWTGINSVRFSSSGGVNQGYGGEGSHIAFDNLTVNQSVVPEPASMLLIGTGLAGVAAARRRRKDETKA